MRNIVTGGSVLIYVRAAPVPRQKPKTQTILPMKKLLLVVSALAISSLSYAGAGCGGSCGGEKKTDAPAPTEKAPDAPKS